MKDRDLWACHLDPELGGQGYGQVKLALMHEILGRCRVAPNIFGNQAPDSGNSELIAIGGTPEQKEQWLEPLLRGEITSSFSLTEPHFSGSDPTMINTRAERDGDEYVINGHKWFASNASKADFILMMAVTNPGEPAAQGGVVLHHPEGHARASTSHATSSTWVTPTRATSAPAATPRSSSATAACRSPTASAPRATASCSRSSGSTVAASTTRCGGSVSARRRST